jgi:hypothetical protein
MSSDLESIKSVTVYRQQEAVWGPWWWRETVCDCAEHGQQHGRNSTWSHPYLSEPFTIYGNGCFKGNDHDSSESRMSRFRNVQMLQQVTLSGALNYLQVSFTFSHCNTKSKWAKYRVLTDNYRRAFVMLTFAILLSSTDLRHHTRGSRGGGSGCEWKEAQMWIAKDQEGN